MGHRVAEAGDRRARHWTWSARQRFDLAFLDLRLGREAGLDLLPDCCARRPAWPWW